MQTTYVFIDGRNPSTARTKADYPYSYDPFTTWIGGNGKPDGSVFTDYLLRWNRAKHDALCIKHFGDSDPQWGDRQPRLIEAFLRDYLDASDLTLCEIQEHCNLATGFPVWYFAYCKQPATKKLSTPNAVKALS